MEMTLTRALVLKKKTQEKLNKRWNENVEMSVVLVGPNAVPPGFSSVEAYNDRVKSLWQSYQDLLDLRNRLAVGIAQANATTTLRVCGKIYTIAEALETKRFYENVKRPFLFQLQAHYSTIIRKFEDINAKEMEKANKEISEYSNKDKTVSDSDTKAMQTVIFNRHKTFIEDPIDLKKQIGSLETEIEGFLAEIDVALTEVNSITTINI